MRADAESSCVESCTDSWHHWLGSLCGRDARRTLRSSCWATNSRSCAGRTTGQRSPRGTGPCWMPSRRVTASKRNTTAATPERIALLSCTPSDLSRRCGGPTCRRPSAPNPFRYFENPFHGPKSRSSKIVEIATILGLTHRPHPGVASDRTLGSFHCCLLCTGLGRLGKLPRWWPEQARIRFATFPIGLTNASAT